MLVRYLYHFFRMSWTVRSVILLQVALIMVGALTIAGVEKTSIGDATYFSVITGLTIGYGDIVASTTPGRIVSVMLGLVGITFTGLVVAVAVRALHHATEELLNSDRPRDGREVES